MCIRDRYQGAVVSLETARPWELRGSSVGAPWQLRVAAAWQLRGRARLPATMISCVYPQQSSLAAVSLEIPGIVVSLEIPVFPIFARKKSGQIVKIGFSDSRDQNKITRFLRFFYTTGISYINPLFQAPKPLKPLKSRPRGQNLPGDPLIAHSDHQGPVSAQFRPLCCLFLTLS